VRSKRTFLGALGVLPALALAAPVAVSQPVTSPGRPAARPAFCQKSFDVYTVPQAVRTACGVTAIPVVSVTQLPGGGKAYHYRLGSVSIVKPVPPKGFDAATASARELARYAVHFPSGLSHAAMRRWREAARHWRWSTPPKALYELPDGAETGIGTVRGVQRPLQTTTQKTNSHWSGYVDLGSGGYTSAVVDYGEPADGSSHCSAYEAVYWTGLGGWGSNNLAQDGTAQGTGQGGLNEDQGWYELVPANWIPVPQSGSPGNYFSVSPGQEVQAETQITGESGGEEDILFTLTNLSEPSQTPFTEPVETTPESGYNESADFIAERPEAGGGFTNLTNFQTMLFENADANGKAAGSYNNYEYTMYDSSLPTPTLATPSNLSKNEDDFYDTQDNCN
jgi:hypothetical protein